MGKVIDITGQIFGKLTVEKFDQIKNHYAYWWCRCSCGNPELISIRGNNLRTGHTISCGCYQKQNPPNAKNITNQIFGFLQVQYLTDKRALDGSIIWHCICLRDGNECDVVSSNLISGNTKSCGCLYSLGEANIQQLLQENNIQFEKEKTFDNLINPETNYHYRYDFYLPDYNRLIEFDGEQHYKYQDSGWNNKENFEKRQQSDKIKNEYALSHNIPLVRIPYWKRDNITLDMLLKDKYLITNENEEWDEIIF